MFRILACPSISLHQFALIRLNKKPDSSSYFVRYLNSYLKKKLDYSSFPKLEEKDLEEQLVHGAGPGGSKVNKSVNCVVLKHIPTNLVVKCHEQRQVSVNKKIARKLLLTKLDNHLNGENSIEAQTRRIIIEQEELEAAKAAEKREKRLQYKQLYEQKKQEKLNKSKENCESEDNKQDSPQLTL